MMYEEKCQLGFKSAQDFPFFYQDNQDEYNQDNSPQYEDEDSENTQNYINQEQQFKTQIVSDAALKLNFDKKVKFAEQLSFKLNEPLLLQSEQPQPIVYSNNLKPGLPKQLKQGKKSKKKQSKKGFTNANMPWMKQRPKSAAKKNISKPNTDPSAALGSWNLDTRTAKYFDVTIDKKAQKEFEKMQNEKNQRPISQAAHTSIVVDKNFEQGKVQVGFLKSNGQVGSKFEVYQNIDTLHETHHKQNYAATGYSMKKLLSQKSPQKKTLVPAYQASPSKKSGVIQIANQDQSYESNPAQMMNIAQTLQQPSLQLPNPALIAQVSDVDLKMQHLIGQTLQSKEAVISALEKELEKERNYFHQVTNQFKEQMKEIQQDNLALNKIKKASKSMERQQLKSNRQQQESDDELDMVPTKEKSTARQSQRAKKSKVSNIPSFRPERVKSSIPKPLGQTQQKNTQQATRYIEELKKNEIERAVQQQKKDLIEAEVLNKLRDHPNEELNILQTEVQLLNRRVEPLLKRVEEAAKNINIASSHPSRQMPGPLGMLSRMGGRLINFYAEDLTEMLLDDFLVETAITLQELESSAKKDYSQEEAKNLAEALLKTVVDYQSEEQHLQMKWNNPAHKLRTGKQLGHRPDPQPISFNLNEDLLDVSDSNPQPSEKKQSYLNPFNTGKNITDPFSQKLAEISQSAPDVKYNMMQRNDDDIIEIKGNKQSNVPVKRKYRIEMDPEIIHTIKAHIEKYDRHIKLHNNTTAEDLSKLYDTIANDLFQEVYSDAMKKVTKDMEEYIEQVIVNEFQI